MPATPDPGKQVVLVTGCSSGLGRQTALHLAGRGRLVVATVRRPGDEAALLAAADGLDLHVTRVDVRDAASIAGALAEVTRRHGPVDVLVNNAGVELAGPVEHTADDELAWQLETNVAGTFKMTRAVLPGMRARGRGRVIFVSSLLGRAAWPFSAAYTASKFAVEGLAAALRWELMPFGVAVSVLRPGRFPSALASNLRQVRDYCDRSPYRAYNAEFREALARMEPTGYEPKAIDFAMAIDELIESPEPPATLVVGADALATMALIDGRPYGDYEREMLDRLGLAHWRAP